MGVGEFDKKPPPGPKVGPTKKYGDLDPEQKEALGGLDKLKAPVGTSSSPPAEEQVEPAAVAQAEEGAEKLEALQAVLQPEEETDPDADLRQEATPTEQDRQEFMRCLLGNRAYAKRYELFGGMLVITFRDIPPAKEDMLFAILAEKQRDAEIKTDDDWEVEMLRLRLIANVESMIIAGQPEIKHPAADVASDAEAATIVMNSFKSSVTYRAVLRTLRIFKLHLEWLLERSLDSDFWEADGLGSPSEPTSNEPSITEAVQL